MMRTRAERRAFAKRAKKRAVWLRSRLDYHDSPWWKFSDGYGKLEEAAWRNGKMRDYFLIGPNKIGRNGQHCKVERTTEKSIIFRAEFESH